MTNNTDTVEGGTDAVEQTENVTITGADTPDAPQPAYAPTEGEKQEDTTDGADSAPDAA